MNSTMVVLSAPVAGPTGPGRDTSTNRVTASGLSAMPSASGVSPCSSPATWAQIAASKRDCGSATSAAAAAVDPPSVMIACGRWASPAPATQAGPCRARPRRRGWSCRRAWSGCLARHACRGCPRGWSRCAPGSPPRPLAARFSASSAVNTTLPGGGARRGRQALARSPGAWPWGRASGAAAGRARPARCAAPPRRSSISPSRAMSTAILSAAAAVRLPVRVCSM